MTGAKGGGVEFRVLGPLEVRVDAAPVAVAGAKPRALLATTALALAVAGLASADYTRPSDYYGPAAKAPNPSLTRIGSVAKPKHFRPHPTSLRGEAY